MDSYDEDMFENLIEYDESGLFDDGIRCDESDKENSNNNRIRSTKAQLQKLDEHMEGNKLNYFTW